MQNKQTSLLWLLLVVQGLCATFFLVDAVMDWTGGEAPGFRHLHQFEMVLALALIGGLMATISLIQTQRAREKQMQRQIAVASGAFADVIDRQFDEWRLSAAERDVAMLSIKGLSVAEIAALRQTKEGTIKAQSAAIYKKAGVSGRLQLLSFFVEELLSDALLDRTGT